MQEQLNNFKNASSRSWFEMNVRPALVLFALLSIIAIAMTIVSVVTGMNARWLITSGTPVQAKVILIGLKKDRKVALNENTEVRVEFINPKTGQTVESNGTLPPQPGVSLSLDDLIPIRIDPDNPINWTARTTAPSLLLDLSVPMVISPILAAAFWLALRKRDSVMKVLITGQTRRANILKIKHSSIAPMSSIIGFAIEGPDRTVRYAYWPKKSGEIKVGDVIEVIDNGTGIAIPARSYQQA